MSSAVAPANVELEKLLKTAQLPALPQSAVRVLELSRNDNNGPPEYAVPLESDPGLTTQVLKFVNSSYFGFTHEISNVRQAIALVGVRTIKNFVLWNAVFSLMPNPKCGPFDLKLLWQDSLRRAVLARAVGKLCKLREAEELFAAALLQDMAIPILAKELPKDYAELLTTAQSGSVRLSTLERERFGWTHADAAAVLARQWKLPGELAQLLAGHVDDVTNLEGPARVLHTAMRLSSLLPATVEPGWLQREAFEATWSQIAPSSAPNVAALLAQVDHDFQEFAPVLKLSGKTASLSDRYQQALAAT